MVLVVWLEPSSPFPGQLVSAVSASSPPPVAHAASATPPGPAPATTIPAAATNNSGVDIASKCPWLEAAMDRGDSPSALARLVADRMTLAQKLGEIVLFDSGVYENVNAGVPGLCIPPLTLEDGPQGVAFGAVHVTQLPAPLGIAASFDTSLARTYGEVIGSEALGQGVDVIQGPDLNIDRVPQNGRSYEGYGEDPELVSAMGVADIEGIQSTGAMAMAKHFAVYSQETDRGGLDDLVSLRALEEIYLPPFRAAVTQAHVASVMCAYPQLNGTYQCQDPYLLALLGQWGFAGFVRSDLGAVHDPVAALRSGTNLLKPEDVAQLAGLVDNGTLPMSAVDDATIRVLTAMFAHGVVGREDTGAPGDPVDSVSHTEFSLVAAERSAVLLKDQDSVLPLSTSNVRSVAVIGADASTEPVTTGYGSAQVVAPFTSTPLDAIRQRAGTGVTITHADGGSTTGALPPVPTDLLTPSSGEGHGLTLTLAQTDPDTGPASEQLVEPTVDASIRPHPSPSPLPESPASPIAGSRARHRPSIVRGSLGLGGAISSNRSDIVLPPGWSDVTATWTGTLTPPRSGLYTLSLQGSGSASLTLDGHTAVADTLSHARGRWSSTVPLVGGHEYAVQLVWDPVAHSTPSGESSVTLSQLTLGFDYVSDQIAAAVAAARKANVAVVFAADYNSEAYDRPSLALPGDQDALIAAVSAANPHTVVVLNTGGPVLMPWLGEVAGVIEAWYPGEEDGNAIAALLFGDVDPSGRLPVTFPSSDTLTAVNSVAQWPGIGLTSYYTEGLEVGYRYDHTHDIRPLFPFGYGLDYTHFALGRLTVRHRSSGVTLTVRVTDAGTRSGTDVLQAYLTYPAAAGEPPAQLVAFFPVSLSPGERRAVNLAVPASAFQAFLGGRWTTVPGDYTLAVGQSSSNLPLSTKLPAP